MRFRTAMSILRFLCLVSVVSLTAVACSSGGGGTSDAASSSTASTANTGDSDDSDLAESSDFTAEVWADNWFALSVNGVLVGEDPVPITTERSFNAETISFEATYPLTIAIEAKDFKETDSGLEYIGQSRQQIGDGGLIAQITDDATGEVVAVTSSGWKVLVIQRAPLNTECAQDADPDATCEFESTDAPTSWTSPDFDDAGWADATEWTEAEVVPRDGYDEISWDSSARLIWGADLEVDNTLLFRLTVAA